MDPPSSSHLLLSHLKTRIATSEAALGRRDLDARREFNAQLRALRGGRARPRDKIAIKKNSRSTIAEKEDEKLWEKAKRESCRKAKLCDHSARKMQWATRYYQDHGGTYVGPKRHDNRLAKWGREKWRTRDGSPSRRTKRYLPDLAWRMLSEKQKRAADATKRRGARQGKQYVRNPKAVAAAARKARRTVR